MSPGWWLLACPLGFLLVPVVGSLLWSCCYETVVVNHGAFSLGNALALPGPPYYPWLAGGVLLSGALVVTAALQPPAEPTVSRSEEDLHNVVTSSPVSPLRDSSSVDYRDRLRGVLREGRRSRKAGTG